MNKKKYTAFVLGSTGLIGNELLKQLIDNTNYEKIYAVSRNPLSIKDPKVVNIISDIYNIDNQIINIVSDHLFIAIGTTKSKTPDPKKYKEIDHDYPVKVAKILKKNGCTCVNIVSSMGANTKAKIFYLKLKGETEESIKKLSFNTTNIYRPSLLLGHRNEFRWAEEIGKVLFRFISFLFIGKTRKYKSIHASIVANAMIKNSINSQKGVHIFDTVDIKKTK